MPAVSLEEFVCKETQATFSDIARDLKNAKWVRSPAREVDLHTEYTIVESLASVMSVLRKRYNWGAVSSNNVYWNLTDEPIRVIQIPDPVLTAELHPDKYISIVNPEIVDVNGEHIINGGESCGSLGESRIPVYRHWSVSVNGYILERDSVETVTAFDPFITALIEHEMDHLEGTIIPDYSPVFYLGDPKEVVLQPNHNPWELISRSFGYVWPTAAYENETDFLQLRGSNRNILLDRKSGMVPTLSFMLKHDGQDRPYWLVCEEPVWIYINELSEAKYGKPIIFEFADTPEFRTVLTNLPELKSHYNFWNIPRQWMVTYNNNLSIHVL